VEVLAGAGAVAGMVAVAVAIWQLRVAVLDRRERSGSQRLRGRTGRIVTGARPVVAPLGRLPSEVVGREELLAELRAALRRRRSEQRLLGAHHVRTLDADRTTLVGSSRQARSTKHAGRPRICSPSPSESSVVTIP
jgi:hypothetical protein